MPELPEVETVRRILEGSVVGKKFAVPVLYVPRMIPTGAQEFLAKVPGRTVLSIGRQGKYLVFHLDEGLRLLFHLRMEGKIFVVDARNHPTEHLSLFIPFAEDTKGLAFYDVRKFGTCHLLHEGEKGPLVRLGKEPFEADTETFYDRIHKSSKPIKELLMDQAILAGLGNIYADEVLFASGISPFRSGSGITRREAQSLLDESRRILDLAIRNNGSTIRTYRASESVHGDMQDFLKVYGRKGKKCLRCHVFRIEKRRLGGRGTSYCPKCQKTGISLAVTGKIGSGKSLASQYFEKLGYVRFSCDDEVHRLYEDEHFLAGLKKKFPEVFTPSLDKGRIASLLVENRDFHRRYTGFVFSEIRKKINDFLIANDGRDKVLEIPLLFDAHWEKDFTFLLGTETTRQRDHLLERGDKDIERRIAFNKINSYDKNKHKLDFIIQTDFTKRHLFEEVKKVDKEIKRLLEQEPEEKE